jgi:hypothetical protein
MGGIDRLAWWNLSWCIGEINITRFPSDMSGEGHFSPAMMDFSDSIFEQALMDLPLVGGTFTWSNCRETPWSRVHRFLVFQIGKPGSWTLSKKVA